MVKMTSFLRTSVGKVKYCSGEGGVPFLLDYGKTRMKSEISVFVGFFHQECYDALNYRFCYLQIHMVSM